MKKMEDIRILITCLIISIFLTSCGQPNIIHECSLNGNGLAICDFKNEGDAKGTVCLNATVVRDHFPYEEYNMTFNLEGSVGTGVANKNGYNLNGNIDWNDLPGSSLKSYGEICSGIVEAQDIRKVEKSIKNTFMTNWEGWIGVGPDHSDFCKIDTDDDYRTSYTGNWYDGCAIFFEPVTENPKT